jgi:hypothetical protein
LYWHKCQCWQVAQHECKFRICSIRCLESCRLDMPINCLRNGKSNLLRKYIDCCFFKILSCHSVYLSHAILSRRSFVAALFCRGALLSLALILSLHSYCRALFCRALKCRRFVVHAVVYSILYLSEWSMRSSKPWVAL